MSYLTILCLFILIIIVIITIKKLIAIYAFKFLEANYICLHCLKNENKVVQNSEWEVIDSETEEIFNICDKCKKALFPNEKATLAEEVGFLRKRE